jgi:DNA-binding NarL/FixJ family response regulator
VRLIVAEDSGLVRDGLRRSLTAHGIDVVADTSDSRELAGLVQRLEPDVVLTDLRMPPTHTDEGLMALIELRDHFPATAGLLLSQYSDPSIAERLLASADSHVGYLLKDRTTDTAQLAEALRRVADGDIVVDPTLVQQMLGRRRVNDPVDSLTSREREVLTAMTEGLSNVGIGERLFLSPRTVERHIAQVFEKLHLQDASTTNRRVLAAIAFFQGRSETR